MRDVHLTGGGEQTCVSLTLMPFTVVMFSFSSDSKDTRRVLLLAPIPGQISLLIFNQLVNVNLISSYELQRVDSSLFVTRGSETHKASAISPSHLAQAKKDDSHWLSASA